MFKLKKVNAETGRWKLKLKIDARGEKMDVQAEEMDAQLNK